MQPRSSQSIRTLSIITILFILYIFFSLIIFKKDVFLYRGSISAGEVPIGLGFIMILFTSVPLKVVVTEQVRSIINWD